MVKQQLRSTDTLQMTHSISILQVPENSNKKRSEINSTEGILYAEHINEFLNSVT